MCALVQRKFLKKYGKDVAMFKVVHAKLNRCARQQCQTIPKENANYLRCETDSIPFRSVLCSLTSKSNIYF